MTLSRKMTIGLMAVLSALALPAADSFAAAPQVQTAAPGYYRSMVGDFEVTALSDGTEQLPVDQLLTNTSAGNIAKALAKAHQHSPLETSFNGFLINTGSKLLLVDTGAGGLFGPRLGKLTDSLKAAGYSPEQVDEIYITHMHPDHVGGLVKDGKIVFPNAIVRADQHDADFWLSQANLDKAPKEAKGFFQGAMSAINPYIEAGHFKPFNGDTDLQPGVKATAAYGHTPGHTVYQIESKGQKLLLVGDLIHVGAVQFAQPKVTIKFDSDSKAAALQRKKYFDEAVKAGALIGAAHLSFPGLGYLNAEGQGYSYGPINYSLPK